MNFDEFVKNYKGKATDYDGAYGVQCVDLAKLYIDKVLGIKPQAVGNAEAYWNKYNQLSYLKNNFTRIANTPSFVPQKGDLVVWGLKHGKYGHIAIADGVGTTSYFYSYDQNWGGKGQGMTRIKHTYKSGFEGVLRPKNQAKVLGTVSTVSNMTQYKAGQYVEVHVPIAIAHDNGGDKLFVENKNMDIADKKQFWIHRSLVQNNQVIARVLVVYVEGNRILVEVFDTQFWVMASDIAKVV